MVFSLEIGEYGSKNGETSVLRPVERSEMWHGLRGLSLARLGGRGRLGFPLGVRAGTLTLTQTQTLTLALALALALTLTLALALALALTLTRRYSSLAPTRPRWCSTARRRSTSRASTSEAPSSRSSSRLHARSASELYSS